MAGRKLPLTTQQHRYTGTQKTTPQAQHHRYIENLNRHTNHAAGTQTLKNDPWFHQDFPISYAPLDYAPATRHHHITKPRPLDYAIPHHQAKSTPNPNHHHTYLPWENAAHHVHAPLHIPRHSPTLLPLSCDNRGNALHIARKRHKQPHQQPISRQK